MNNLNSNGEGFTGNTSSINTDTGDGNSNQNINDTFTFYSSESSAGGPDPFGTSARLFFNDPDYFIVSPKRTKWFNNILRARESSGNPPRNSGGQFGPNSNTGNPNN